VADAVIPLHENVVKNDKIATAIQLFGIRSKPFLGRLDVEIEVGVPNVSARKSILSKLLAKQCHASDMDDDDVDKVAQAAHGFVGADLVSI
jgi:ATP-dependent 26S proteasome regulatory subunit